MLLIFIYFFTFPFFTRSLFHCPISVGPDYHYPNPMKQSDFLYIMAFQNNIRLFQNETQKVTTSVSSFDTYATVVNCIYRTIYVTQRKARVLEQNTDYTQTFILFDHDTTELSAFIIGDYDFYELAMYQTDIEIRHIDEAYTLTNYTFTANDIIEHLSCSAYNEKIFCAVVINKAINTIIFISNDTMKNQGLSQLGDMKQSEGVKVLNSWSRLALCSITTDATIQCDYIAIFTTGDCSPKQQFEFLSECNLNAVDFSYAKLSDDENLGCCASGTKVKCQRMNNETDYLIGDEIVIFDSSGANNFKLGIVALSTLIYTITWESPNDNMLYSYWIFVPVCNDGTVTVRFYEKKLIDFSDMIERKTENILYITFSSVLDNTVYGNLRYSSYEIDTTDANAFSALDIISINQRYQQSDNFIYFESTKNETKGEVSVTYTVTSNETYSSSECTLTFEILECHPLEGEEGSCYIEDEVEDNWYYNETVMKYKECDVACATCVGEGNEKCNECNNDMMYYEVEKDNGDTIECILSTTKKEKYFFDGSSFKQCDSNCENCIGSSVNCTSCPSGKVLSNENNTCIEQVVPPPNSTETNTTEPEPPHTNGTVTTIVSTTLSPSNLLNSIAKDIDLYNNPEVIYKGVDYYTQVYDITKQDIVNHLSTKYSLSTITLDECIDILKSTYLLPSIDSIILVKIDRNITNSTVNQVTYVIYDSSGRQLDHTLCNNTSITITKPIINPSLLNITKAKSLFDQGIDVFDTSDSFFNSLCYPFASENSTDVITKDRRSDYYQNVSFCESNCAYESFDYDDVAVNCSCDTKTVEKTNEEIKELKIDLSTIENVFVTSLYSSNILVVKCYNLVFDIDILIHNKGFWIFIALNVFQLFLFLIYCIRGLKPIEEFMLSIHIPKAKPRLRGKDNDESAFDSEEEKEIKIKPKKKRSSIVTDITLYTNKERRNVLTSSTSLKEVEPIVFEKEKVNRNSMVGNDDTTSNNKFTIVKKSKFHSSPHTLPTETIASTNIDDENKMLKKIKDLMSHSEYINLPYEKALLYDNRSFCLMYWDYLKDQQIILNTFIEETFLELRIIKIFIFVLSIGLEFALNALFYSDSYISEMYYNNGVLDFISSLPKSLYSCIIGFAVGYVLSLLSNSKEKLQNLLREATEELEKNNLNTNYILDYYALTKQVIQKLKIKLFFFFTIDFIIMIFFLYYASAFCAVYQNSQKSYIIGSITSLVISMITPFAICFCVCTLRMISLSSRCKCLYSTIQIINKVI